MINVMKQVDDNSFTWQTIERTAGMNCCPILTRFKSSAAEFLFR